jgi:NAD(P)-dependent dehydrogenase (short-subunit alcohol dehydrogenase family)
MVTGSSAGIGAAIAKRLADGANLRIDGGSTDTIN